MVLTCADVVLTACQQVLAMSTFLLPKMAARVEAASKRAVPQHSRVGVEFRDFVRFATRAEDLRVGALKWIGGRNLRIWREKKEGM